MVSGMTKKGSLNYSESQVENDSTLDCYKKNPRTYHTGIDKQ